MSSAEGGGAPAPQGFWPSLKSFLIRQLSSITIVSVLGVLGTLIIAYFQNMSAYQDKVATQAKDEMAAATQVFAEASTALSSALSLQQRLIDNFYDAVPKDAYKDDNAYPTKSARALYKDYLDAYTSLHQNYDLLARKAEIYLDWPSDLTHDAAKNTSPTIDPINMSDARRIRLRLRKIHARFCQRKFHGSADRQAQWQPGYDRLEQRQASCLDDAILL